MRIKALFLSFLLSYSASTVASSSNSTPAMKPQSQGNILDVSDDVLAHVQTPLLSKQSCLNFSLLNKATRGFISQYTPEVDLRLNYRVKAEAYNLEDLKRVIQQFPYVTCLTGDGHVFEAISPLLDQDMSFNVVSQQSRNEETVVMKPFTKVNTIDFKGEITKNNILTLSRLPKLKNFKWTYALFDAESMMTVDTDNLLPDFFSTLEKVTLNFINRAKDTSHSIDRIPEDFRKVGILLGKAVNLKEINLKLKMIDDDYKLEDREQLINPSFVNSLPNLEILTLDGDMEFSQLNLSNLNKLKKCHINIQSPEREERSSWIGLEKMILNNPHLVDFSLQFITLYSEDYPVNEVVNLVKKLKDFPNQWKHLRFRNFHIKSEEKNAFNISPLFQNSFPEHGIEVDFTRDILDAFFTGNTTVESLHMNLDYVTARNFNALVKVFSGIPKLKHLRFYDESERTKKRFEDHLRIGERKDITLPFEIAGKFVTQLLKNQSNPTLESFEIEFHPDFVSQSIAKLAMDFWDKGFEMTVLPADPKQGREYFSLKFAKIQN